MEDAIRLLAGRPPISGREGGLVHVQPLDRFRKPTDCLFVEENRRASLGLALNWGLRFLLAYALKIRPARSRSSKVRDLRWVHCLIETPPDR